MNKAFVQSHHRAPQAPRLVEIISFPYDPSRWRHRYLIPSGSLIRTCLIFEIFQCFLVPANLGVATLAALSNLHLPTLPILQLISRRLPPLDRPDHLN